MTDRNPDDLYDALRDRLADYGQEPPAALWAGIRAQLPPPVAAPKLRRRRRRVPAAWLFLLTLTLAAAGAGWHWWQTQPSNILSKGNQTASRTALLNANQTSSARAQNSGAASSAPPAAILSKPKASQTANTSAQRPAADADTGSVRVPGTESAASEGLVATRGSKTAAGPAAVATAALAGAAVAGSAKAVGTAAGARAAAGSAKSRRSRNAAERVAMAVALNSARGKNASARTARAKALGLRKQVPSAAGTISQKPEYDTSAADGSGAGQQVRKASSAATTRAAQALATLQKPRRQPLKALIAEATPAAGRPLPPSTTLPDGNQPPSHPAPITVATGVAPLARSHPSQRTAPVLLPPRPVAVQVAAGPERAAPQSVTLVPSLLPRPFASRWAVQVVAGPALTYRALNSTLSLGPVSSTSPPLIYNPANGTYPPVATLERPALGSAAQITVRRTLGGHWSLSAGLGYAEYASALALQQVHTTTNRFLLNSPDSISSTSIHRRDTYRFVTVPVRVGYAWTLSRRWRVGVLAGADAAVYVGGSSTEGSSCVCQSQTWSFANSPYRRLSVGASLGAEVRYRLGADGRWELLAQPTATYLLTPLAPATTAYYQRHLFGGAALLGVAFNLP